MPRLIALDGVISCRMAGLDGYSCCKEFAWLPRLFIRYPLPLGERGGDY